MKYKRLPNTLKHNTQSSAPAAVPVPSSAAAATAAAAAAATHDRCELGVSSLKPIPSDAIPLSAAAAAATHYRSRRAAGVRSAFASECAR